MSEVLTQQEIDRLLSKINAGNISEEDLLEATEQKEVYDYDFRRPTRVSKDHLKTIRNLHENFSELFGFYLASRLQTMATVELLAVDQLRYSEYVLSIANPCVVYIFDIKETEGRAVIEMSPDLVFMIVERLLGGIGTKPSTARNITAIEQRIMQPLVKQALKTLSTAWKPLQTLNPELIGFESNSDFVQIAPASEIVVVISFEIKVGDESFLMNVCYPSYAIEDILTGSKIHSHLTSLSSKAKQKAYQKITSHLQNTPIEVTTKLGSTQIKVRELLELEIGDILYLDTRIEDDIPIYVQDSIKFYGRPGTVNDHISVKITQKVDTSG